MHHFAHRRLFALLLTAPLAAQQGNELVFVGTSGSGSSDPYFLVAADTGALVETAPRTESDNNRGAVWADQGANLYLASAPGVAPGSQPRIARASWNGASSTWSTFHQTPGASYGIGLDQTRRRLWTLTGTAPNTRELRCIDADPTSPSYGQQLAQTGVLSGAAHERWSLSASGNYAAVAHSMLSTLGCLDVVDLDPSSPTYLQNVAPVIAGGGAGMGAAISDDDHYAYLLCSPPAIVVYHIPTATVLDFNPGVAGQQNFTLPLGSSVSMALSGDRSFAVVSGIGNGGWAARVNFDYTTPANTALSMYLPGQLPNCYGVSISPDNTRVALTTTPTIGTPNLLLLDAASGAILQRTELPGASSVTFTAWQRAPQFATYSRYGQGCAGSLGTPTLGGANGSKPVLGGAFVVEVGNLPLGIGLILFGESRTALGGLPLPLDLGLAGMPGCTLLASPDVNVLVASSGPTGTVTWNIPASPSNFGTRFYTQAFALDPLANAGGFVASNGAAGQLGY
jgi:hypothetical protein